MSTLVDPDELKALIGRKPDAKWEFIRAGADLFHKDGGDWYRYGPELPVPLLAAEDQPASGDL